MEPFDRPPAIVGHRGAPVAAPENTPVSFQAAADAGASWVELDVRLTSDGSLVVHHDPRLADGAAVNERTAEDLAAVGVWAFVAVLAAMPPGIGVNVEIKNIPGEPDFDEEERAAALVVEALGDRLDERPWMTSSFNPATVAWLAEALPRVPSGLVHFETAAVADTIDIARAHSARALCPRDGAPGLDADGLAAAHEAGLAVMVWTVDDPDVAERLAADGVDALCTNDPGALVERLGVTPRR